MKTRQDLLFLPAPLFMIRTPLLPIEQFFQMLCQEGLNDYLLKLYRGNQQVRQAILIASPSLDEALQAFDSKSVKDKEQIFSSLLKYVLRMSTRPTPFGLFAFIATGSWGDKASVDFNHGAIEQRARPDMEWLFSVIDRICHYPAFFLALPIRSNPLITYSAGRYFLDHVRKTEDEKEKRKLSIRATIVTSTLLEIAKSPITIEEAERQLMEKHPMLEQEKVREVISTLLEQQFLISHLHPTLLTTTPFEDLLKKLAHLPLENTPFSLLKEISEEIKEYNQQNKDDRYDRFHAIQEKMKGLAASPHFLQVDAAYEKGDKAETLPQEIGFELARVAEVLWKLSFKKKEQRRLNAYRTKFLERYSGRLVPLLELLGEQGLGPPEHYRDPNKREVKDSGKQSKFKQWLTQEYCSCLHNRRREIVLTDELVALDDVSTSNDEEAALSFDLFFEVIADSPEKIEQGDYLLYISQNTFQGGSIFGRFIDLLDDETTAILRKLSREEEQLEPEVIFVETSYLSSASRTANVSMNPNLRSFQLDLNGVSEDQISFEDILVGVSGGRFFLMHKEKGKELVFTSNNVLNYLLAPIPIRFIKDASFDRVHLMNPFSWDSLDHFPYLPRVRFGRAIISPAKWNIDLSIIKATSKDNVESIANKFQTWAEQWDLPRYLFLTSADNRILLDRNHPQHRNEISIRLKQDTTIKLVEKIGEEKGEWVSSDLGSHVTEFVAPFIKNKKYCANPQNNLSALPYQLVPSTTRRKLFGSEWLYVKFYLSQENEIRFLVQHLSTLTHYLQTENIIQDWFFVRYSDPAPHIRVRFRANSEEIISKLTPLLHQWCQSLLHDHLFSDIQISIYDREIERYGGEQLIEDAETFFCADSVTALTLLQLIADKKIPIPDYVAAAISLIDLLNGFEMNLADMCQFLKNTPKDEIKGFREWKAPLSALANFYFNTDNAAPNEDATLLNQAFQKRKTAQHQLASKMADLQNQGLLNTPPSNIQESILHMHCNRLMGINGSLEKKARAFALHTLESLLFRKKL